MTTQQKIKMVMIQGGDKGTIQELSGILNISLPSATNKVKGKQDFKLKEVRTFAERYNLSDEQICEIFVR